MTLTQEDLKALSVLLDEKLEGQEEKIDQKLEALDEKFTQITENLQKQLTHIEVDILENNVIMRLDAIEACYLSTYKRYKEKTEEMDSMALDIEVLKVAVSENAEKLQQLQVSCG